MTCAMAAPKNNHSPIIIPIALLRQILVPRLTIFSSLGLLTPNTVNVFSS